MELHLQRNNDFSLSGPLDTWFREGLDIPGYFDYTIVPERSELFS